MKQNKTYLKELREIRSRVKSAYDLLTEIGQMALREPERMAMGCWITQIATPYGYKGSDCGTVGCIAGWTCVIAGMIPDLSRIGPPLSSTNAGSPYNMAANLLGLNGEQRDDLFLDNLDHEQLIHDARQQTCDHAKRVVKHINRFQKEHGEQLKRTALSL